VAPENTGRALARPISHHAEALAGVRPGHGGIAGGGGCAEHANSALTPDAMAKTVTVAPEDASRVALRIPHHAEAVLTGVRPGHGGKPGGGGCAEHANLALTTDTMAASRHAMHADAGSDASAKNSAKIIAARTVWASISFKVKSGCPATKASSHSACSSNGDVLPPLGFADFLLAPKFTRPFSSCIRGGTRPR
jgi:hypothetical protein